MADNQTLYPGDTGTAFTAAADEIASVKYPRVKITWGVDGTATDASASNPLPVTFSSGTVTADTELPTAAALADNTSNPTVPAVGGFNMSWDGSTWDRMKGDSTDGLLVNLGSNNDVTFGGTVTCDTELPAAAALADNTSNPTTTSVGSLGMVYDGSTWDRQKGDSTDGTLVNLGSNNDVTVTSGSITADTELPAAAALTDNFANPTAPATGSFNMLWDGSTWDRKPGNSTDGTLVNLGTNNDVTVTSGSITADTELPAAAALADNTANPTVPGTGSFNLFWDGSTWDRQKGDSTDGMLVNLGANSDVNVLPVTAGGLTPHRVISAATTNATSVKASAGQVYGWYITNVNAAARYVKFYNKASAPTVGTDTPVMTLAIPANGGANVEYTNGVAFATGIALAITTGATDADTGAVAANEIIVNTLYK